MLSRTRLGRAARQVCAPFVRGDPIGNGGRRSGLGRHHGQGKSPRADSKMAHARRMRTRAPASDPLLHVDTTHPARALQKVRARACGAGPFAQHRKPQCPTQKNSPCAALRLRRARATRAAGTMDDFVVHLPTGCSGRPGQFGVAKFSFSDASPCKKKKRPAERAREGLRGRKRRKRSLVLFVVRCSMVTALKKRCDGTARSFKMTERQPCARPVDARMTQVAGLEGHKRGCLPLRQAAVPRTPLEPPPALPVLARTCKKYIPAMRRRNDSVHTRNLCYTTRMVLERAQARAVGH